MTAIKPIENKRVVAVAAETYPINAVCSHPDCEEPTADPHHAFPRSAIGGDSYFVSITFDSREDAVAVLGKNCDVTEVLGVGFVSGPIPHATGLCRNHHDIAEARRAKITLEGGVWIWWEGNDGKDGNDGEIMAELGELAPQPGAVRGGKKRKRLQGQARRQRRTISIKVPNDTENGGEIWDEVVDRTKTRLVKEELYSEGDDIPVYEAVVAGLNDWLAS